MKIDYELVEKIGATHYNSGREDCFEPVRLNRGVIEFYAQESDRWLPTSWNDITHIKPIPPKPQVRVEYEKVTGSIFDLKDEFENGELYEPDNGEYEKITLESDLVELYGFGLIYRLVERSSDWRDDVSDFIDKCKNESGSFGASRHGSKSISDDDFLEMCRVALRANGEL